MIKKNEMISDYVERAYDLSRISGLPITDKFRLINYIKLVGKATEVAREKDISDIKNTHFYEVDPSFHLLISLIASGIQSDMVSQIIEGYCHNFEDSDIYYAKLVILGAGTMMIQNGFDRDSVVSYLVTLLGDDFLRNNFGRIYEEKEVLDIDEENKITIKFKNFDYTYRKLKYDLLALLKIKREQGKAKVKDAIFTRCDNKDLKFYYTLLDLKSDEVSEYIYHKLMKDAPKMDRFIMTAVRCILTEKSILETHYLLNAIIGKYTRFEKPYSEVIDEIKLRETEILS